jgi:hypothetical protein
MKETVHLNHDFGAMIPLQGNADQELSFAVLHEKKKWGLGKFIGEKHALCGLGNFTLSLVRGEVSSEI